MRALVLVSVLALCAGAEEKASILDVALEVARRDRSDGSEAWVRREVVRLARTYRGLTESADGEGRAVAFRRLLFEFEKFESVAKLDSARHLHIDSVLKGRRGYCLSLSIVALCVAEEVGVPLFGVALPNHFLVRYDDGKVRRNLELTRRGEFVSDEELARRVAGVSKEAGYLRNLRLEEVKACLLHNRGYVSLLGKKRDLARADFEAALALMPGLPEAWRNLGVVLGEKRDWKGAKKAFVRAVALNPGDVGALVNLAICRWELGERVAAMQDLEMVIALDPELERAEKLLAEWREKKKEDSELEAAMPPRPAGLKPGLLGQYFGDIGFERLVVERVDSSVDFDWQNEAPARGVPRDRFGVRWTGVFKAPRSGTYSFFLVANDGVRLSVGGKKVLENWRQMGFENWYGTAEVPLKAGWHPLVIEHFDAFGGARVLLRIGVEGVRDPLDHESHFFHAVK